MKKKLLLVFILQSLALFSQQLVKELPLKYQRTNDVFQVVEEDKKQVSLFFSDKYKTRILRFNDKLDLLDSLATDRPSSDYNDIVGYSISGSKYYSYWSNSNNKEIAYQCFDFDSKQISLHPFTLEFSKEKAIKTITINNVFYLVTLVKNSSILNFYVFKDGQMDKKTVDLSDKTFINWDNKKTNLWDVVSGSTAFEPSLSIQNILNETAPSLTFSANKRKAYTKDNTLILSLDRNKRFTQLISFNLTDFSASVKSFNQPFIPDDEFDKTDSNSFLLEDKIIQMRINSEMMILSVKDLDGNEIKTLEALADQEIAFKNSEITQENGKIRNTRILDNSNQLLRKIYNLNPSVSCYKANDKIYLTLGSVSLPDNNGAMYGALIGGMAGALIGAAISSNYSVNNLNSYNDRKVVYINCLFDSNFNHIDGNIKKLAFDELRVFADKNDHLKSQTVFKFNSDLYFGGYDKTKGMYSFYKFND